MVFSAQPPMTNFHYQSDPLETIQDFIRWGASLFFRAQLTFGHGTDNPFSEAKLLVLHVLGLPWDLAPAYFDCRVTQQEKQQITELFRHRTESRMPAAYLIGEAYFAGLKFTVTPDVLVPRSPIAELIEQRFEPWVEPEAVTNVLDLCTGSGCIGIACLKAFENAQIDLVDVSAPALSVAQANVDRYTLADQVQVIESDLFAGLAGRQYDLIVSNPPYVDAIEMQHLPDEFQKEPALGLAAGQDGLDLVRRILAQAADFLTESGTLIVEVGVSQYYLQKAYPELPFYWFAFEQGGEGVFALQKSELDVFSDLLQARIAPGVYPPEATPSSD